MTHFQENNTDNSICVCSCLQVEPVTPKYTVGSTRTTLKETKEEPTTTGKVMFRNRLTDVSITRY